MMDPLILNVISIASLFVGVIALIQAACYNHSAKETNKRTEQMQNHMDQMQKYMENMINHSNLLNMYTFLGVREMLGTDKISSEGTPIISLTKDTVIFTKGIDYSTQNADACKQIIFQSGVMKPKVYGKHVSDFLSSDAKTLKITLRSEVSKSSIEDFMSMSSSLLDFDVSVLHNIHF